MPKAPHRDQLGFVFDPPVPATGEAALAGLEQRINSMVGTILNSDGRSRNEIAAAMTDLLGEEVSRFQLDAYASPARTEHRVPASRLWALVQVTGRHDLLDQRVREIGAALLVGEEVHTARIGHINKKIRDLREELRQLERSAPLIREGGMNGNAG